MTTRIALRRSFAVPAAALLSLGWLATACQQAQHQQAQHDQPLARIEAPAATAAKAVDATGLHNMVAYSGECISGAVPEGEAGLATLKAMGIKTVVSVDGATPDVAAAEALGLRYIHLPISYDTVSPERQRELAQVIANAEGPIYMHCHHGKHRSAAALGSAMVLAGKLTPEQAVERMKVSGTSKDYQGLWKAVQEAQPLPAAALQADVTKFPKVSKVSGLVALMNELDVVIDNVKASHGAAWGVPANHPDLVPAKETKRLASVYEQMQSDPESREYPADYQSMLEKSLAAARALDAAVRSGDKTAADAQYSIVQKGCKECHKVYRDQ
jgi:protein tyrosine phosphatase (PTP) superfamily phosphohydrolase (DUF442 family)